MHICRKIPLAMVLFMSLSVASAASGQDILEDAGGQPKNYLLELSGTIGKQKVLHTKAVLSISEPLPGALNPYLVIIKGYPYTSATVVRRSSGPYIR
jgi:hypothetical protein